ncbi:MAG: lipocalin-like domain-containing protein [Carboxylicivirga sp.]|jgi:hypothetical protein|nr:lipocalin-like domain-containing protein [Carboxylicivirga sp.]
MEPIKQLVGTWKLESIYFLFDDNTKMDMYGDSPLGILMYDDRGYMNAQLGFNKREEKYNTGEWSNDPAIKSEVFDSFMAYYGKYYEESPGKIIHLVEGCVNPDWIGEKEIRFYKIDGDTLKIWTPKTKVEGKNGIIEVIWKRANNE